MFIATRMQQAKKGPQLVRLKLLCFGYPGTQPAFSIVYFYLNRPLSSENRARHGARWEHRMRWVGRKGEKAFSTPLSSFHHPFLSIPRTPRRALYEDDWGCVRFVPYGRFMQDYSFFVWTTSYIWTITSMKNKNMHWYFFADITYSEKWTVSANYT